MVLKNPDEEGGILGNHGAATIQQPLLTGTVTSYLPTAILTSRDNSVLSRIGSVGLRYNGALLWRGG